jgi:hypothetical protein
MYVLSLSIWPLGKMSDPELKKQECQLPNYDEL